MLQNPIHLRLGEAGKLAACHFLWPACANVCIPTTRCSASKPSLATACFIVVSPDLIWETLTVKDAKVNFDSQLEKLEEAIPAADDFDMYGVYPAIDACVALSELIHSRLSGETLEHAIEVSKTSITTVAMLEMTRGRSRNDRRRVESESGGRAGMGYSVGNFPPAGRL